MIDSAVAGLAAKRVATMVAAPQAAQSAPLPPNASLPAQAVSRPAPSPVAPPNSSAMDHAAAIATGRPGIPDNSGTYRMIGSAAVRGIYGALGNRA